MPIHRCTSPHAAECPANERASASPTYLLSLLRRIIRCCNGAVPSSLPSTTVLTRLLRARASVYRPPYRPCPGGCLQVRLFYIFSRALTAGQEVSAEEAAQRVHQALVRWAGRGGLHEQDGDATMAGGAGGWALWVGEWVDECAMGWADACAEPHIRASGRRRQLRTLCIQHLFFRPSCVCT